MVRTNAKSEEVVQELLTELFQKSAQIDLNNAGSPDSYVKAPTLIREICKYKELIYNKTPITSVRSIKFIEKHGFDHMRQIKDALEYLDSQHKKYEECLRSQRTGVNIDQIICSYSFMPAVEDDRD